MYMDTWNKIKQKVQHGLKRIIKTIKLKSNNLLKHFVKPVTKEKKLSHTHALSLFCSLHKHNCLEYID